MLCVPTKFSRAIHARLCNRIFAHRPGNESIRIARRHKIAREIDPRELRRACRWSRLSGTDIMPCKRWIRLKSSYFIVRQLPSVVRMIDLHKPLRIDIDALGRVGKNARIADKQDRRARASGRGNAYLGPNPARASNTDG